MAVVTSRDNAKEKVGLDAGAAEGRHGGSGIRATRRERRPRGTRWRVASGGRAVRGHVELSIRMPYEIVRIPKAAGINREGSAGREGIIGSACFRLDVERRGGDQG